MAPFIPRSSTPAPLVLLLLLALPCLALCDLNPTQLAAARPWGFKGPAEAMARAQGLQGATPAARRQLFHLWAQDFSKTYPGVAEQAAAHDIWQGNLDIVIATNSDPASTWVASMNEFADMSADQFSTTLLGAPPAQFKRKARAAQPTRKLLQTAPPAAVDWLKAGKVTAIRRQAKCGACWAFATVAAVESMVLIKNGTTYDLSEQQIIDCASPADGFFSSGCSGGSVVDGLSYVYQRNVTFEGIYPFTGVTGTCNATKLAPTKPNQVVHTTADPGFTQPAANSRAALMTAVASRPTAIYFNANSNFQLYKSGVFPAASCTDTAVNHAMLVIGYNTTGYHPLNPPLNTAHWRFKNSWGTGWGELGYARVQMLADSNGACAMYTSSFMPSPVL